MKTFRNPERQKPEEYMPYVPQYKELNIQPLKSALDEGPIHPIVLPKKETSKLYELVTSKTSDDLDDLEVVSKDNTSFSDDSLLDSILSLEDDNYLIIVSGVSVSSGSLSEIQDEANKLIFGEHPNFPDESVDTDRIMIVKKVKLKVGVFFE